MTTISSRSDEGELEINHPAQNIITNAGKSGENRSPLHTLPHSKNDLTPEGDRENNYLFVKDTT